MIEKNHFGEMEKILSLLNKYIILRFKLLKLYQINKLLKSDEKLRAKRQNFLFSATLITKFTNDVIEEDELKPKSEAQLKKELKLALNSLIEKVKMVKEPLVFDLTTEAITSENLVESKLFCTKTEKDIYLYYFTCKYVGRTLVFANSIDCVRRLTNLFRYLKKTPLHLHANMNQKQRLKNLEKFNGLYKYR
jgi:ATP-dependent RNA helicase DDX24/MAK5